MRKLAVVGDAVAPARRLPSASQLQRAFMCAASETLPHMRSTSEYATRGSDVHAFIARARTIGRDAALAEIPEEATHRDLCQAIPLDELPTGGDHELAVAWDYTTDTARVLTTESSRDYADARPTEFVGTADYLGRDDDGVIVIDWKTGYRYLGPAKQSRQLRLLALAGARLIGVDKARAAYFFLRDDGTYGVSWATFDVMDLAEIADEMGHLVDVLDDARRASNPSDPLDVHEGDHCDYCPAFNSCPAKMNLALAIGVGTASAELTSVEQRVEMMTDEQLGEAYARLDSFYVVADKVKNTIRQRAAMREVPLPDGRVLGTVQWPWTSVNVDKAREVIAEMHGEDAVERALPRKATLTAIKKLGKATLVEIEKRGGIVTGSSPQVRAHRKGD